MQRPGAAYMGSRMSPMRRRRRASTVSTRLALVLRTGSGAMTMLSLGMGVGDEGCRGAAAFPPLRHPYTYGPCGWPSIVPDRGPGPAFRRLEPGRKVVVRTQLPKGAGVGRGVQVSGPAVSDPDAPPQGSNRLVVLRKGG